MGNARSHAIGFQIIVFTMLLLAGCASAPPQGYYSKQGTQRAYQIDGKWYSPVDSSNGYEEEGIASWYGRDFHGNKTSNGETYNMHAMTAAHKTLPLGTYVKVTRLDNGKETVVRINDRGPFVKGRIIDLSYKAASEVGIADSGTAKVKIAALGDAVGDKLVARDYQHGNFMVQAGAFTVNSNAAKLRDNLLQRYSNVSITTYDRGDTVFYRVRVGGTVSLKEAERLKSRLEAEGVESPFVVAD
ncbi:MAG: septal ring lytic transglycosylase RlpA family protein [Deltaproteobacteria bacterium]|nr:septal ring lytic transglycosylase RlpA family protein [Deltaproteobacteria bacterium]